MKSKKLSPIFFILFSLTFSTQSVATDNHIIELNTSLSLLYHHQIGTRFMEKSRPYYIMISSDFLRIEKNIYYAGQHIGFGKRIKTKIAEFSITLKGETPVYTNEFALGVDLIAIKRIFNSSFHALSKIETSYFFSQKNSIGSGKSKPYFYNLQFGLAYRF